jgi:hypothetical protein
MSIMYYYSVYDFIVQSELFLPTLGVISHQSNAINPITISYGAVSNHGLAAPTQQGFTYQATNTDFWLNIPFIARFLVSNGQQITIEPNERADEDSIHTFLFSTCIEVLLRQRQKILLSGYALKMSESGVALLGDSSKGASMLQNLFYKRGHSFLTSNFLALNDEGFILPGIAQIEAHTQIVSALKIETDNLQKIRPGIEKYVIPLKQQYHSQPLPLRVIYTLKMHQKSDIIFTTIDNDFKIEYLRQLMPINTLPIELWGSPYDHLSNTKLLDHIDIICIHLPATGLKLPQIADAIETDVHARGSHYVSS